MGCFVKAVPPTCDAFVLLTLSNVFAVNGMKVPSLADRQTKAKTKTHLYDLRIVLLLQTPLHFTTPNKMNSRQGRPAAWLSPSLLLASLRKDVVSQWCVESLHGQVSPKAVFLLHG